MHSSRSKADEKAQRVGFDCGFLVPGCLNPMIRDELHGRYWSGMVLARGSSGYTLLLSVHFIHKSREDVDMHGTKLIDDIREETLSFWQQCKQKFGARISIIAGFDANVTLPSGVPGVTGSSLLDPLLSHSMAMQQRIVGWMQTLGITAINTFGSEGASDLWTCGIKRKASGRSQIDYIGVSQDLSGTGKTLNFLDLQAEQPLIKAMDHRPVKSELEWCCGSGSTPARIKRRILLPKRKLQDELVRGRFHDYVTTETWQLLDLSCYETALHTVASTFYDLEAHHQDADCKLQYKRSLELLRNQLRFESNPSECKLVRKRLWATLRALKKSLMQ